MSRLLSVQLLGGGSRSITAHLNFDDRVVIFCVGRQTQVTSSKRPRGPLTKDGWGFFFIFLFLHFCMQPRAMTTMNK